MVKIKTGEVQMMQLCGGGRATLHEGGQVGRSVKPRSDQDRLKWLDVY